MEIVRAAASIDEDDAPEQAIAKVRGLVEDATLVDRMSCAPARIFHLPGGMLRRGSVADITVFDPDAAWQVDPASFLSKGRNTPYAGKSLRGRATCTIVGGQIVYRLMS